MICAWREAMSTGAAICIGFCLLVVSLLQGCGDGDRPTARRLGFQKIPLVYSGEYHKFIATKFAQCFSPKAVANRVVSPEAEACRVLT